MIGAIKAMDGLVAAMNSLASAAGAPTPTQSAAGPGAAQSSFSTLFSAAVDRLDGGIASAQASAQSFASGNQDIPLSDVMVSLEQAGLALQVATTVRDKVLAAYTTIMNMPV